MLSLGYGTWYFWEIFPMKVTFDGINKLILINEGESSIDVEIDIYSNWKEWVQYEDNGKFVEALSTTGGDPLPGSLEIGSTFFLENGWKVKYNGVSDITIDITGNLFTRDGSSPYLGTGLNISVNIISSTSSEVRFVDLDTLAINNELVASNVWSENISGTLASILLQDASNNTAVLNGLSSLESNLTSTIVIETSNAISSDTRIILMEKVLRNKSQTDPATGIMTIFDDDNITPILAANIFEDTAGVVRYSTTSTRIDRRDRLA